MFRVLKRTSRNLLNEKIHRWFGTPNKVLPVCSIFIHHCEYNKEKKIDFTNDLKTKNVALQNTRISSSNHESSKSENDKNRETEIKNKILEASLQFVSVHGWTKAAIVAGAQSIGYSAVISEMFPSGGGDLVLYFYSICNENLRQYLKNEAENESQPQDSDKQKSVKLFVYDAVEKRLRMIIPYIDKWPQALATLTLSRAVPTALSNLLTLVDDICYYAGDQSVDLDWYIRRIALAGIYKATELYMLQDKSPDYENTWACLKKQLDDAAAVYSCIRRSGQASQLAQEISIATFTTARNILGLSWKR